MRIFDEDTVTFELALDSCTWHFERSNALSRRPPPRGAHRAAQSWPMKGLPILGVGTHAGNELVMFGVCESTRWEPYDDGPRDRYKSQIEVRWKNVIYRVPHNERPTMPTRSNSRLTRAQYVAWRGVAVPLMDALQNPLPSDAG